MTEIHKTVSGRIIKITPNHSNRTFTIRVEGSKYRTYKIDRQEFESSLNNTGNDWSQFLKSDDYYTVKP